MIHLLVFFLLPLIVAAQSSVHPSVGSSDITVEGDRTQYRMLQWTASGTVISSGCSYDGTRFSCGDGTIASSIELPELAANGVDSQGIYGADSQSSSGCIIWPVGSPGYGQTLLATSGTATPTGTSLTCRVMQWSNGVTVGSSSPSSGDCDASGEVGRIYIQTGDPASVAGQSWVCRQTGESSYGWQPLSYLTGTTAPATCVVGQVFFDTDATAGSNWYGCTSSNTWTAMGGGGGGGVQYVVFFPYSAVSAGATRYIAKVTDTSWASSEIGYVPVLRNGTAKNMRVRCNDATGADGATVYTLRINGADTSLSVTFNAGESAGNKSNTTNTVSVSLGDRITFKGVDSGATNAGCTVSFVSIEVE